MWPLVRGNAFSAAALWMATYFSYLGLVFYERTWLFNAVRVSVIWLLVAAAVLIAALYLRRSMASFHPLATRLVWLALTLVTVFSAIYAILVFASAFASGWDGPAEGANILSKGISIAMAIASSLAFTLGGLGMVALGLVQWRAGKLLQIAGIANGLMGLTTLFLWVEISARLSGISNYDMLLGNSKPLSWLLASIIYAWWTITGLLLLLGLWKGSRQNRVSIP